MEPSQKVKRFGFVGTESCTEFWARFTDIQCGHRHSGWWPSWQASCESSLLPYLNAWNLRGAILGHTHTHLLHTGVTRWSEATRWNGIQIFSWEKLPHSYAHIRYSSLPAVLFKIHCRKMMFKQYLFLILVLFVGGYMKTSARVIADSIGNLATKGLIHLPSSWLSCLDFDLATNYTWLLSMYSCVRYTTTLSIWTCRKMKLVL